MSSQNLTMHDRVAVHYKNGSRSLKALKRFHQGERIIDLPVSILDKPDMYSLEVLPGIHIDCSQSQVGAINHSCNPNAAVRRQAIVAWNCINEGDEITIDYKRTETKLAVPFDCKCGSKNCRGRIE